MDTSPHLSGQPGNDTARLEVAALVSITGKMMSMKRTDAPCMVAGKSGAVQPHPERTGICSAIPATGRNKRWHRGYIAGYSVVLEDINWSGPPHIWSMLFEH